MDKRLKLFLALLCIGVLVILGFLGKAYVDSKKLPAMYSVATEANEKGENFSANVHARNPLKTTDVASFSYSKRPGEVPLYAMEFPYNGLKCTQLGYTTYVEEGVMVIDQHQEKKCDKPQDYFITSLLASSESFSKIRINQWIDEDLINLYEFDIDPTQDVWPADTDLVVEQ